MMPAAMRENSWTSPRTSAMAFSESPRAAARDSKKRGAPQAVQVGFQAGFVAISALRIESSRRS